MSIKLFFISILTALVIIAGYYGYKSFYKPTQSTQQIAQDIEINKESDNLLQKTDYVLPEGEQLYNVSHGKEAKGPKMSQIVYTPLSFKQGETQKIKIVFPEKEVVGSVVVFVTTDTKENQKVSFTKDSKTNTWTGEWTPEDTIQSRYSVKIVAVGAAGEYNNTMYFL